MAPASLAMPPPRPSATRPLAMVRPAMVTVAPPWMSKTRLVLWPLTVSWPALGHSMSRLLLMTSSPLVSVMVWPASLPAKWMVSPLWAAAISARSEPEPLSRLLVTVSVLSSRRSSSASSRGRNLARRRVDRGASMRSLAWVVLRFRCQEGNNMTGLRLGIKVLSNRPASFGGRDHPQCENAAQVARDRREKSESGYPQGRRRRRSCRRGYSG